MARSGGRSQWEREMAAQRKEAERQAREQVRLAKEREKARRELHLQEQQRATERKTAGAEQQIKILDDVLASGLRPPVLTFDSLRATPELPPFDPGSLGTPRARSGLGRLCTSRAWRHEPSLWRLG
jgi:restriction system protein